MNKSTIIHTAIISGQSVNVPAPQAGETLTIQSSPSGNLNIQFDISTASPEREDNDLVLNTESGSIVIAGFFEVGEESLPSLTFEDGTTVDATAFFEGSGLDLTTAAGEAADVESSGTNYSDDAGSLLLGVDRLGMLDSEAANAGGTESLSLADAGFGSDLSDLGGDLGPEEVIIPPIDYDLRAILYRPSGSSDNELHLNIKGAFGAPDPSYSGPEVIIGHPEYAKEYFTFDPDNPFDDEGNLVLTLSEAGKNLLQSNGGASIYDYITISINGVEHTIQVVANGNGRFDSDFEHPSGNLDENGLAFGEWHQGQDSGKDFSGHNINSSALADDLSFTGNIADSKISTNDGNDRFDLTGNITGSVLDLGDGDDKVLIDGDVKSSEIHLGQSDWENRDEWSYGDEDKNNLSVTGLVSDSLITGGRGYNVINISGGVKDSKIHMDYSTNSIQVGGIEGSEVSLLGGTNEIYVWGNASNSTFTSYEDGKASLSVYGVMNSSQVSFGGESDSLYVSSGMKVSTINMGDGYDYVSVAGGVEGSSINMGDGADSLSLYGGVKNSFIDMGDGRGDYFSFDSMDNSSIRSGQGSVSINASGDIYNSSVLSADESFTLSAKNISGSTIEAGDGYSNVNIKSDVSSSSIKLGDGSSTITIGNDLSQGSSVEAGDGYSNVNIKSDVSSSSIKLGDGSSTITIGNDLSQESSIETGIGKDEISISGSMKDSSYTSLSGDSNLSVSGTLVDSKISTGDGNTVVSVVGDMLESNIQTGSGTDKIFVYGEALNANISTGYGQSDLFFKQSLTDSNIVTGGGGSTLEVKKDIDGSQLNFGDGTLSVIGFGDLKSSSIKSGVGDEVIQFAGLMQDSSITGGAGDSTVYVGKDMTESSISLGAGKNSVSISGVMLSEENTKNIINTESGAIYIGKGMQALGNGQNIINTGAETENKQGQAFNIKGESFGMEAAGAGASNIIIAGDYLPFNSASNAGDLTITVSNSAQSLTVPADMYGMNALDGGLNSISLGNTNVDMKIVNKYGAASAMHAENGTNRIENDGNIKISIDAKANFDAQGLSAQGGVNSINSAGTVTVDVENWDGVYYNSSPSSHVAKGLFSDDGQNIIKAGGDISINVNSKNGADVFVVQAVNGSSEGFSNELESGGKLTITGSRVDHKYDATAQTTVIKGVSAEGARNSLSAEDSIIINVENKSANNAETYGVQATASGENHFNGDASVSSAVTANYTPNAASLLSHGVSAEDNGKNIFNGDLDIKSQASGYYLYANAESYGLHAGSNGQNIIHGGLTVLSSATGAYGTSYGVLAENYGINQVGEMDNLAHGDISITSHGLKGHLNYGKEGQSIGMEASDHGQNLFYTTGNVYMLTGDTALSSRQSDNNIGLHAKDNGLNRIYTDGGNIEFEAKGGNYNKEQVTSTVRADNGMNIVETTSGNISMKTWDGNRAHALEAINHGENHIITQTGDIHLWAQPKTPTGYLETKGVVYAESGGVNYIGNVHHDADGKPLDQHLTTENGITVTIESAYSGSSGYSLEARDGGTNIVRTNAGDDTIRLIGNVETIGSGKNIIDAGEGDNTIEIVGFVRETVISTGSGDDIIDIKGDLYNTNIDAGTGQDIINGLIFYNKDINNPHYILSEYGEINLQQMSSSFERNTGLEISGDIYSTIETIGADVTIYGDKWQQSYAMKAVSSTLFPTVDEHVINAHNLIKTDSGTVSLDVNNTQQAWTMVAGQNSSNIIETNSGDIILKSTNRVDNTTGSNMALSQWTTHKGTTALNKISTKTGDITLEAKSATYVFNMRGYGGTNLIETEDGNIRLDAVGQYHSYSYNMYAQDYGQNKIVSTGNGEISLNVYKVDPSYWDDGRIKASGAYGLNVHGDASNVIESKAGDIRINVGFSTDRDYVAEATGTAVGMYAQVNVNDNENIKEGDSNYVPKDAQALNRISTDSADLYLTAKGTGTAIGMSAIRYKEDMDKESTATNIIETKSGNINISALAAEGGHISSTATGMFAEYGGKNIIRAIDYENNHNNISITITAKGNKLSQALSANYYGENHIITGQGDDTITLTGDIYAVSGGVNRIETHGGDDSLTINGNIDSYGKDSKNIIALGDGNNTLTINGSINAGTYSEAWVSMGSGDDTVNISGSIGGGSYVMANKFYMDLGDGNNILSVEGAFNSGHSVQSSFEIRSGSGDDTITVGEIINPSNLLIDTGAGDDSLTVNGNFFTGSSGYDALSQVFTGAGNDNIHIKGDLYTETSATSTSAISSSAKTLIDTGSGDDFIQIDGALRAGQKSTNEILTGAGDDTLIINGGLYASVVQYTNVAKNIIDTGSGNDIVTINGGVFGTKFSEQNIRLGDGHDILTINGDIELHVYVGGNYKHYNGKLLIEAGEGDDIIIFNGKVIGAGSLTVDGGTGYDQLVLQAADLAEFIERYGAWLKQPGLIENIEAIKFEGLSEADRAELQSGGFLDNLGGIPIYTDDGILTDSTDLESFSAQAGVNYSGEFSHELTDLTGMVFKDGDDRLVFNNKLSNSVLSMGEGDDLVVVNSNMESIQLNMGEGNDSLYINHAALDSQINMGSGDDHLYINSDFFSLTGSSFDGGEGDDTLHLQGSGEIKLSEVADVFKGFETIDLSGGGTSKLDINSLISNTEKTLMIKGDEGFDKVTLSEDWSYKETQIHDNINYEVYSNGEDEAATLILIQLGLIG